MPSEALLENSMDIGKVIVVSEVGQAALAFFVEILLRSTLNIRVPDHRKEERLEDSKCL